MQPVATHVSDGARPAILSGWLYIPYEAIGGRAARDALKSKLTFRPRFQQNPDEPREIALTHDWAAREYLGVPRSWGLQAFRGQLPLIDRTTRGAHEITVPKLPQFDHPRVLDPAAQRAFYDGLVAGHGRMRGFVAKAGTGTGKTVVSLREAGEIIRRPTLILLHLERLMWQWYEEIQDKLGVDPSRIGVIQSDRCEWEGKDFAVGMLHSVAQREYPREFYRHWGHTIYDEAHKVGTQFFAPVVYRFPSYNWLALSATVERDDGGERVFFLHLGTIRVTSNAAALPIDIRPVRFLTNRTPKGSNSMARVKWLSEDHARNTWLCRMILDDYRAGRQGLYVSELVQHVQTLIEMLADMGVPREAMGQYTGQRITGVFCPLNCEESLPDTIDQATGLTVPGPTYSRLRMHNGRLIADLRPVLDRFGKPVIDDKRQDVSDADLTHAKTRCQLTFATYGMIVEGIDEPRWDCGLDLTPRGKATQLIGRVRRPLPNKPSPYWRTPFDEGCSVSRKRFHKRCRDYRSSGATIREMA